MDKNSPANDVTKLTNNNYDDYSPLISGNKVTWYGYPEFDDSEIYFYDGQKITRLTNNNSYEFPSDISGSNVVWSGYDGNDSEIYLYKGTNTIQITDNNNYDYSPRVDGNKVVWYAYNQDFTDSNVYLYDGTKTIQLTNNNTSAYGPEISGNNVVWYAYDGNDSEIYLYNGTQAIQITNNDTPDYSPRIDGNKIVWSGYDGNDDEIYLYDGTQIIQLTNNDTYDYSPQISGNNVVWLGYDGNDSEIYLYNGTQSIQITNNNFSENDPQIDGNRIVWSGYDGNDEEIYLYDGDITQLTDNNTYDYSPQISGNKVVWNGYDGSDYEIYLYEIPPGLKLDGTEGDDILTGGRGPDTISGFGGDDILQGLGGNDLIFGGSGNDLITGGDGKDRAEGGLGNDTISGNSGNDILIGNEGNDNILGGEGNDSIEGGAGQDRLLGQAGDDLILGQGGNDILDGGDGVDLLVGGAGSDRLVGGRGNDSLSGNVGADTLVGGFDNDSLDGGVGNDRLVGVHLPVVASAPSGYGTGEIDTLFGNTGSDTFVLGDQVRVYYDDGDPLTTGESDYALITDYNASEDTLERYGTDNLYKLDYFTTPEGRVDAAMIYDPGVTARGETIAILQGKAPNSTATATTLAAQPIVDDDTSDPIFENTNPLVQLEGLIEGRDYAQGEVIIKLNAGVSSSEANTLREKLGAEVIETTKTLGIQRWSISGTSVRQVIESFGNDPRIEYIQPNFIVRTTATIPSDPRFKELWGLNNTGQTGGKVDADIDAPEAWDTQTGSDVVVGVIDTGVDYTHPDLNDNMWKNPGEVAGDGIDNDGNGFVDDVYGYDFVYEDSDPMDVFGHGTHVSGTIAAEANNNQGIVGVNWNAKIMALKFLSDDGWGYTFDAIQAVEYATLMKKNHGVNINLTNNSWGGGGYDQGLYDAIAAAGQAGQLFIAAAGNGYGNDNDTNPFYPATYNLDNVISVAATNHNDQLAYFSNIGATTVDLAAPGENVLSTVPGGYAVYSGTSMATPHVAGVASLFWSEDPSLSTQEVQELLLKVDPLAALAGKVVANGRLNAFNALSELGPPNEITGTGGDDVITGTNRRDRIFGLGGNDVIQALAGKDTVFGGAGNDLILADEGDDSVEGGAGNDRIFGGDGDDILLGQGGSDSILSGEGNDSINGGDGLDRLLGEAGNDTINGGNANDTLDGGEGNDYLNGGANLDRLFGGRGDDTLLGAAGADSLFGGLGNDSLNGGAGSDRLVGVDTSTGFGTGEIDVLAGLGDGDVFVLGDQNRVFYSDNDPVTTGESDYALITDFNASQDSIQLHGLADQYSLDFFTVDNTINAALIYDPGDTERGELIGILSNVSAELTIAAPAFAFV
jgi:beta propeller repeat protein